MTQSALSLARILLIFAVLVLSQVAAFAGSLVFSVVDGGRASGFSQAAGTSGVSGMRWGIIIDTEGNGFHAGQYDGDFDINTSGFLTRNGGSATDDYYVAHDDQPVTTTLAASTSGDLGGAGSITSIPMVDYASAANISEGDPFILVWFPVGTATGDAYGTLANTSGPHAFLLPAETVDYLSFDGLFDSPDPDPIKTANHILTSPIPGPEIVVQQPAGETNLTTGTASINYGPVAKSSINTKQFRIHNGGNADLTGVAASIVDGDGSYTITLSPGTTVAPGGETFVDVQFSPATAGTHTAKLHIASNDDEGDENPFVINLTGSGIGTPGVLSFDPALGSAVTVSETAASVSIALVRSGGTDGQMNFTATATGSPGGGTATAGVDFGAPTPGSQVIAGGSTTGAVVIPIPASSGTEPNETFTVTLSSPTIGTLGAVTSITVVIVDNSPDTANPAILLAKPTTPTYGVEGLMEVSGTATDNKGVDKVEVVLDGGATLNAVLTNRGGMSTPWRLDIPGVSSGAHSISVTAIDTAGRPSTPVVRNFIVTRKLVVEVDDEAFGGVTAGFSPDSYREVGKSYTITASAKSTGIFAGWTVTGATLTQIGIADSARQKATLTFIFREGLQLTANFEDNPYDNPGVAGTYNGLVHASVDKPDRPGIDDDGSVPGLGTEGYFTALVQATGAFSGKLTLDGTVLNVAGIFDDQGRARFGTARAQTLTVPRTGKPSLIVKFDIGGPSGSLADPGQITGEVEAKQFLSSALPASVSVVSADRAHFTGLAGQNIVPDEYLTVTGTAPSPTGRTDGVFTVILPSVPLGSQPDRISSVLTELDYPKGTGLGTIRVTKAGAVTLTGTLSDGTTVTAATTLSSDLRAGLFAQLYTAKGFLSAPITLDRTPVDRDVKETTGQTVLWCRPFNSASHYYPYGWAETLELDLLGAKYVVTAGQSVMKAPDGVDGGNDGDSLQGVDADGNVELTFADGLLMEDLVKAANLTAGSTTDMVVKVPSNDPTFTMTVTRANGMVTGTFIHTDDKSPNYSAIIFQKGPNAGAYGFFLSKQPTPIDYTGESGAVTILGQAP